MKVVLVNLQDALFFLSGLQFLFCQIFYKIGMPLVDCGSTCEQKKQMSMQGEHAERMVCKMFIWKSSISYREHQSSRLSHASVLLKESCLEFFLCHFTVSEVVRPIF